MGALLFALNDHNVQKKFSGKCQNLEKKKDQKADAKREKRRKKIHEDNSRNKNKIEIELIEISKSTKEKNIFGKLREKTLSPNST